MYVLNSLQGTSFFAGKRFYFGCGGGTASFGERARQEGYDVEVAEVLEDGKSDIREILCISKASEASEAFKL